ncbi:SEC-C domain-containing protein [candidate division KSB1 bacterium]|nr:SEC-C domain-containing protein [candidate division KSB1 bacterium]
MLGFKLELPDPATADRVLTVLHSLHNQLAETIEDNLPLSVRRTGFGQDKEGPLLWASDLWREVYGFRKGLSLGTYAEGDFPKAARNAYDELADEQDNIKLIIRRVSLKRKPYTSKEIDKLNSDLEARGKSTTRLMRFVSHQLHLDRVNRYKAQGVVRIGRNDPCPCGSGKKFKQCCMDKIKPGNPEYN